MLFSTNVLLYERHDRVWYFLFTNDILYKNTV